MAINALSELEDLGDGQKPWCDLVFEVVDPSQSRSSDVSSDDGAIAFHAVGAVPSGEIGFSARVSLTDWTSQQVRDSFELYWGKIQFRSTGAQTDRLLAVYEEWFDLPQSGAIVPQAIGCTAVLLGHSPRDLEKEKISMKIFFDSATEHDPESYAELFLNFDLPAGRAWLRERIPVTANPWPTGSPAAISNEC